MSGLSRVACVGFSYVGIEGGRYGRYVAVHNLTSVKNVSNAFLAHSVSQLIIYWTY